MKQTTLQLHKEAALLCEEGMTPSEVQNALLIPQIFRFVIITKPWMEPGKTCKHCTNYGQDNHNVEIYRVKKKEKPTITTTQLLINLRRVRRITRMPITFVVQMGITLEEKPLFTTGVYDCFLVERDILQLIV